jgi:hypothetical protein
VSSSGGQWWWAEKARWCRYQGSTDPNGRIPGEPSACRACGNDTEMLDTVCAHCYRALALRLNGPKVPRRPWLRRPEPVPLPPYTHTIAELSQGWDDPRAEERRRAAEDPQRAAWLASIEEAEQYLRETRKNQPV